MTENRAADDRAADDKAIENRNGAAGAAGGAPGGPGPWWNRRRVWVGGWLAATGWAGVFPVASALSPHRTWGLLAALGYTAAALAAWSLPRRRARTVSVALALTGAVLLPLPLLVAGGEGQSEVSVIERSASRLLATGTPYLPDPHGVADYTPYLPGMALFGLPRAVLGDGTWYAAMAGDPRVWCAAVFLGCLVAVRRVLRPTADPSYGFGRGTSYGGARGIAYGSYGRGPSYGSGRGMSYGLVSAALVASPLVALPLCVSGVDLPLTGACLLGMALAARGRPVAAGLLLALACSLKWTAWPAVPVAVAALACAHGGRAALRGLRTAVAGTAVLVVPGALLAPAAMAEQVLAFPVGLADVPTPAASPLPGHLLAGLGPSGWVAAVVLLLLAAVVTGASLVLRPPVGAVACADRLALGLTAAFALAPAGRFGYLLLPAVLAVWTRLAVRSPVAPAGATGPAPGHRGQVPVE
ncbi:glycosyltransferase 87 family protein [Streptomyces sp. URMC 123]|uniref:glycosyltransferase 87 family protein n=1 Tax=Streptomyces sp. URMC 123 TaxID=3423403 RepID=UPI003F1A6B60